MADTFPLPIIESLDAEKVLDLEELGSGPLLTYIKYDGIIEGDTLYPNWRGCSESGEVIDFIDSPVDVSGSEAELAKGMLVNLPNIAIAPLDQGWAFYSYAVRLKGETTISAESRRLMIYIGKRPAQLLPAAHITQSHALCINIDELPGEGASVSVLPYQAMAVGDKVTFSWSGYMQGSDPGDPSDPGDSDTYQYILQSNDIGKPLSWIIEKSLFDFIENGFGYLDYTIDYAPNDSGLTSIASRQRYEIIPAVEPKLEAPIFDSFSGADVNPDKYPNGITVRIPLYEGARIGDDIRVYGMSTVQTLSALKTLRVDPSNLDSGRVECVFDANWLKANNWQTIQLFYQWGRQKLSRTSNVLEFQVRQTRSLIAPMVKTAYPDDEDQFMYDAMEGAVRGASVIVPDAAIIEAGDTVHVEWAFVDGSAAYTGAALESNPREFKVPLEFIPAYMGKRIDVVYSVVPEHPVDDKEIYYSAPFNIEINKLPVNQYTRLKCALEGAVTEISRAKVPSSGAQFYLDKWKFMAADQLVTIEANGGVSDAGENYDLCRSRKVVLAEAQLGKFDVILPLSYLNGLTLGEIFSIKTSVSFDGGESYQTFPTVEFKLVA